MRCWRCLHLKLSLTTDFVHWRFISELSDELISLNVNILFAWGCLRCLDISSEKFLSGFRSLLFEAFGVIFALVCLEELIGVSSCRDDHRSIRAPTENTLIVHDVLWIVFILVSTAIRVLILLFLGYYARMCRETLPASSTTRLLQHFLNFI